MGRVFLKHMGGRRQYICKSCKTYLTNRGELLSTHFSGSHGQAFLFGKVVNLKFSEVEVRVMTTGRHFVRDVYCKKCEEELGWFYEFATHTSQRYKEGKVILECERIEEIIDHFAEMKITDD